MPAAGVPDSTPAVALRVTPLGRVPVSVKVGAGKPVAVTVKVPAVPTVKVVESARGDGRGLVDGQREALGGVGSGRRWSAVMVIG